jgi:hypothetical protein
MDETPSGGLDLSAPYLQLLDIDEALQAGMPVELALDYLGQLEDYLMNHYDTLVDETTDQASLLRDGLLRLTQAAQGIADNAEAGSLDNQRWLEIAHRANQLLMQGSR